MEQCNHNWHCYNFPNISIGSSHSINVISTHSILLVCVPNLSIYGRRILSIHSKQQRSKHLILPFNNTLNATPEHIGVNQPNRG